MRHPLTLRIKNRTANFDHIRDSELKRRRVLDELDRTHFQWLVVFVAGIGFLADGYDIYAASLSMPMLNIVYFGDKMQPSVQAALNASMLVGTVIGQLGFGIFADVLGRKRMYGLELLIIIGSTIGIAMSSRGEGNSMSMLGWLISWRVILGVGIGGDYPLSAVITSEFAPTKSRGRMLATVFFMQPIGYLVATIVSIIALAANKSHLSPEPTQCNCSVTGNHECCQALDSVWRWTVGFGTIPAILAIYMRFSIPESPRYTIEVLNRPNKALDDLNDMDLQVAESPMPPHATDDVEMQEGNDPVAFNTPIMHADDHPPVPLDPVADSTGRRSWTSSAPASPMFRGASSTTVNEAVHHSLPDTNHLTTLAGPRVSTGSSTVVFPRTTAAESERPPSSLRLSPAMLAHEELPESSSMSEESQTNTESRDVWKLYRSSLSDYLWNRGHWAVLLGTSLSWFCFDFAFYVMGPNSSQAVKRSFNGPYLSGGNDTYSTLMLQSWHELIMVCLGSLIGGIAMIFFITRISPRKIQLFGFLIVFVLLIVVGLVFRFLPALSRTPLVVFLYVVSMIFFQVGPNFTTYIIPAEIFPTQLRCTGAGISAAAGKTAAVIAQIFGTLSKLGPHGSAKDFGEGIIVFSAFMLIGAGLTKWLTPETRTEDGKPQPLEDLEFIGKKFPINCTAARCSETPEMAEVTQPEDTQLPFSITTAAAVAAATSVAEEDEHHVSS